MTSKERAELRTKAMKMESIFQVGKSSLTPQLVDAIRAALKARELIKVNVLKNCSDDTASLANLLSERTGAEVVQVIGKTGRTIPESRKPASGKAYRGSGVKKRNSRKQG